MEIVRPKKNPAGDAAFSRDFPQFLEYFFIAVGGGNTSSVTSATAVTQIIVHF